MDDGEKFKNYSIRYIPFHASFTIVVHEQQNKNMCRLVNWQVL